jgi:hypothetical protein
MLDDISKLIFYCPFIITLFCAELFFLLVRSSDITILAKKKEQRTKEEELRVNQGLRRGILLESLFFVPASAILFRLTIFPLIGNKILQINSDINLWYAIMGIAGYGFPFAAIKNFITKLALKTLKEFAEIATKANVT